MLTWLPAGWVKHNTMKMFRHGSATSKNFAVWIRIYKCKEISSPYYLSHFQSANPCGIDILQRSSRAFLPQLTPSLGVHHGAAQPEAEKWRWRLLQLLSLYLHELFNLIQAWEHFSTFPEAWKHSAAPRWLPEGS